MRALHLILAAALVSAVPAVAMAAPANVAAAVAASSRSADNVKLDQSRKPAEVLNFLGLQQGMSVVDLFGGNRYWAEIMAPAVGPNGSVVVWEPKQFLNDKDRTAFTGFAGRQPNVVLISSPMQTPLIGADRYDFAMLNLNYHDVYWESTKYGVVRMEPDQWLKSLFAAMKPGGVVGVIDHVGPAGDTRALVEKLHRIDPAVVKADFERAGFVLEAQSDMLRNPADDHSLLVFDDKIRGKTDRFVYRFRKPQ